MPASRVPVSETDPIRSRLRGRRLLLGLTFQRLAHRAGLRSPAYVFHIENGGRIPTEAVAIRLARALGEDERVFGAWARALQRADLRTVLDATRELLQDPELSAFAGGTWTPPADRAAMESAPHARLRIPLIANGDDPGDGVRPTCPVLRTLSLDAPTLGAPETLVRPFAYVLDSDAVRRVPELGAGRIAIVSRAAEPPGTDRVYAVRAAGRIELGRVLWNGGELVVLPAPGASDFVVLPAAGAEALHARVAGMVARTLDPSQIT